MATIPPPTPTSPEKIPTRTPVRSPASKSHMRAHLEKQFQVSRCKFQEKRVGCAQCSELSTRTSLQRDPSRANGQHRAHGHDRPQKHALQQWSRPDLLDGVARNTGADQEESCRQADLAQLR